MDLDSGAFFLQHRCPMGPVCLQDLVEMIPNPQPAFYQWGDFQQSPGHQVSCFHFITLSSVFKSNPDVECNSSRLHVTPPPLKVMCMVQGY